MRSGRRFAECARRVMRPARRRDAFSASDDVMRRLCCFRRRGRGRNHARAAFRVRIGRISHPSWATCGSAKPWLFRGRPDTPRRWFRSNLVGRRVVHACGARFERHVSASARTPQTNHSPGARSIDATVRFCNDKVEQIGRALTGRTCAVLVRIPSSGEPQNTHPKSGICSMAEHDPPEDQHSRSSMWRAVGYQAVRIALVTNCRWIPASTRPSNYHLRR